MQSLLLRWAVGALLLVAVTTGSYLRGRIDGRVAAEARVHAAELQQAAAYARAEAEARAQTVTLAAQITTLTTEHLRATEHMDGSYRGIIAGLSARQGRPDPDTRPDTQRPADSQAGFGATGAQLSGPDSRFLAGEAARADAIRLALRACYDQYDALRALLNGSASPTGAQPPAVARGVP